MQRFLILSAAMALAACAAPSPQPEVADASTKNCHKETRVGSNIPIVVCDEPQSEADRQHTVDVIKRAFRPVQAPVGAGG